MNYYILKDGEPVQEPDILAWAIWMSNDENNRVALTEMDGVSVSTVFLGREYSFFSVPHMFETMIFGGEHDRYQERYHTLEEAMIGHERAVALVKGELHSS